MSAQRDEPYIGRPELAARGHQCCGKPHGCTNLDPGCAYLEHPYKRWLREEITLAELEAALHVA